MPLSIGSFTVPKSSVKSCEETERRRPGKDVMRAERITAMHRKRIEAYQQVMREVTTQILDRWQLGVVIDVASEMDDLALIIEGRTVLEKKG
jgi:hypothetical protein